MFIKLTHHDIRLMLAILNNEETTELEEQELERKLQEILTRQIQAARAKGILDQE